MAHIIIGADLVPTESNIKEFEKGASASLIDEEIARIMNEADFRCFNLETPLIQGKESGINKWGPCIGAPASTAVGIKSLNIDFMTLANNHIMDYGEEGLQSTIEALKSVGIQYGGIGKNLNDAKKMFYTIINRMKIGIYCCAEHEFSIASESSTGVNPYDPLNSFDDVELAKKQDNADFVIVLYHGGKEHYRYPSPQLQKICHKFIEKGADLVVCQHSHCIGCKEDYKGGTIVYGQGNFIFDYGETDECWKSAVLIDIDITGNSHKIDYIPIIRNGNGIRLAKNKDADDIIDSFNARSNEILNPQFVHKNYQEYAEKQRSTYLGAFLGHKTFFFRGLNRITNGFLVRRKIKSLYRKKERLCLRNFIECEAHREMILTLLRER